MEFLKNRIIDNIVNALFYIWQLPQNLLGLIVILVTKAVPGFPPLVTIRNGKVEFTFIVESYNTRKCYFIPESSFLSGASLGKYIILRHRSSDNCLGHELGHSVQSMIFGPLYLLIIGVPSAVFNNVWDRLFHKKWDNAKRSRWYYSRFPEKWADKLGGVNRFNAPGN